MINEGYELWGTDTPGFSEFWQYLTNLCDPDKSCPGCRRNGGLPSCPIRKCARERQIEVCVYCEEYPCKGVLGLAKGCPNLVADGRRIQEIGITIWINEQEERVKTGFAYVDIRCYPYDISDE